MTLNISSQAPSCINSPEWEQASRDYTARKARMSNAGNGYYKRMSFWTKTYNFLTATRGPGIMAKAWQESSEHVAAALLREQRMLEKQHNRGEMPAKSVWQTDGVARSLMRQDVVRYRPEYLQGEYRTDDTRYKKHSETQSTDHSGKNKENKWALRFGSISKVFHGMCEIFAAPTGMTSAALRNTVHPGMKESGTANKALMTGTLGLIGVGTTYLIGESKNGLEKRMVNDGIGNKITELVADMFVSFSSVSSLMGLAGTITGAISQMTLSRPNINDSQKAIMEKDLSELLHKVLHRVKSVIDDPVGKSMVSKAMIGSGARVKIGAEFINEDGTPRLLQNLIDAVQGAATQEAQMKALTTAIGDYLSEDLPTLPESPSPLELRRHNRQVETREKHFRALCRLVNHTEIDNPQVKSNTDVRKMVETSLFGNLLHKGLLIGLPAALLEKFGGSDGARWAKKLKDWSGDTPAAKAALARKKAQPAEQRLDSAYMMANLHQYGIVTRTLLRASEACRVFNNSVVLSSNAQASRLFNNLFSSLQRFCTQSVASRTMCASLGRFFGGAAVTAIFGFAFPALAASTGGSLSTVQAVGGSNVRISYTNIGNLMFLVSIPTLALQLAAKTFCYLANDWKGDIAKPVTAKAGTDKAVYWGK
ncbi:hypothetical protein [Limnobacter sp.]|uniref:hypothetical protein n=1 Tax=Limnobacter sp. TaxID=2003368 RepID=UPI0035170002